MSDRTIPDVTFALDDLITTPDGPRPLRELNAADVRAAVTTDTDDRMPWRVTFCLQQLMDKLDGDQTVGDLDPDVFSAAYYRAVEQYRYMGSGVPEALEGLISLLPTPEASQYVRDWPADEQDIYRNRSASEVGIGGWDNFDDRRDLLTRHRKEKLAQSIVTSDWFIDVAPEAAARLAHAAGTEIAPDSKALRRALRELSFTLSVDTREEPSVAYLPSAELIERAEALLRGLILPDTPTPTMYTGKFGIGFSWGPQNNRFYITVRDDRDGKYWEYYLTQITGTTEDRGISEPPYHQLRTIVRNHLGL